MRAYAVPEFGTPGEITERPIPQPAEGEILVRVRAAGVNAMDTALGSGVYKDMMEHRLPLTPGGDYAGTVEAVGPGVEGFAVGDEVYGDIGKPYFGDGSFAEYVTASARQAVRRPDSLSPEVAAALPRAGTTALAAVDALDPGAADTVVIVGAAGGVGAFATQLAARRGSRVLAVTSGDKADFVRDLGAADVIDYSTGDTIEQIRQQYPDGVDGVLDLYHDAQGLLPFAAIVKPGGRIVSTIAYGIDQAFEGRPVKARLVAAAFDRTAELGALVAEGALTVRLETMPLVDAERAMERQSTQQTPGKVVLLMG